MRRCAAGPATMRLPDQSPARQARCGVLTGPVQNSMPQRAEISRSWLGPAGGTAGGVSGLATRTPACAKYPVMAPGWPTTWNRAERRTGSGSRAPPRGRPRRCPPGRAPPWSLPPRPVPRTGSARPRGPGTTRRRNAGAAAARHRLGQDLDDVQQPAGQRTIKLDGHVVTAGHRVDLVVARYDRRHRRTAGDTACAGGSPFGTARSSCPQLTFRVQDWSQHGF